MPRAKVSELLSDTQFGDDSFVPLYVLGSQIIQEPSALTHKLQKTSTRMMVFLMNFEMFGQVSDPLAEERNLDFRRSRVTLVEPVLLDNCFLLLRRKCQLFSSS